MVDSFGFEITGAHYLFGVFISFGIKWLVKYVVDEVRDYKVHMKEMEFKTEKLKAEGKSLATATVTAVTSSVKELTKPENLKMVLKELEDLEFKKQE